MATVDPELVETLEQLRDIHYPDEYLSLLWPPSIGNSILFIVFSVLIIYLLTFLIKKIAQYYTNRIIRIALRELNNIDQDAINNNPIASVQKISLLLKQCALVKYKKNNINSLAGKDWLLFLNKTGGTTQFTSKSGQLMTIIPYVNNITSLGYSSDQLNQDINTLIQLSKKWIKNNL